jgi:hypothetical protein
MGRRKCMLRQPGRRQRWLFYLNNMSKSDACLPLYTKRIDKRMKQRVKEVEFSATDEYMANGFIKVLEIKRECLHVEHVSWCERAFVVGGKNFASQSLNFDGFMKNQDCQNINQDKCQFQKIEAVQDVHSQCHQWGWLTDTTFRVYGETSFQKKCCLQMLLQGCHRDIDFDSLGEPCKVSFPNVKPDDQVSI